VKYRATNFRLIGDPIAFIKGYVRGRFAMTSGRVFLTAMIIATFVAPAARSENGQPTALVWVSAFSAPAWQRASSDGWRKDAPDQWKPEAP
jgi:hypothetical protein